MLPDDPATTYSYFESPFPAPDGVGLRFNAVSSTSGSPLWYTNGTLSGTYPLGGSSLLGFRYPVALGNKVVFQGASTVGVELFITDGTSAGTQLLADIEPGPQSSIPILSRLPTPGGRLCFTGWTPTTGRELFQTDGTAAGTVLVADILPGPGSSKPVPLGFVGGKLALAANPHDLSVELYVVDQGQLTLVKKLRFALDIADYLSAGTVGNRLLITATKAQGILVTDGSPSGTTVIHETLTGSDVLCLGEFQPGRTLFAGDFDAVGKELMQTNGTTAGTKLLKNIELTASLFGSTLAELGCPNADELFATLLSPTLGTPVISVPERGPSEHLLGPGSSSVVFGPPMQVWLGDHDELLLSAVDLSVIPVATFLAGTDGTTRGTTTIASIPEAPAGLSLLGSDGRNALLYGVHATLGRELWVSDGTTAGTYVIGDLLPTAQLMWAVPSKPTRLAGSFFLSLPYLDDSQSLWRTDGSLAGTSELVGGLEGDLKKGLMPLAVGGQVFFVADDGVHGTELWVTDGTIAGTHMVKDILSGPEGSKITELLEFQGQVHFLAKGTEAGTVKVTTVKSKPNGKAAATSHFIYFEAQASQAAAMWAYDGLVASPLLSVALVALVAFFSGAARFAVRLPDPAPPSLSSEGQVRAAHEASSSLPRGDVQATGTPTSDTAEIEVSKANGTQREAVTDPLLPASPSDLFQELAELDARGGIDRWGRRKLREQLIEGLLELDDPRGARAALERHSKGLPHDTQLFASVARGLARAGQTPRSYSRDSPRHPRTWTCSTTSSAPRCEPGDSLLDIGALPEAFQAWSAALIAGESNELEGWDALAKYAPSALVETMQTKTLGSNHPSSLGWLAEAYWIAGQEPQAIAALKKAASLSPYPQDCSRWPQWPKREQAPSERMHARMKRPLRCP